jgi:hypothetical protein
VFICLHLLLLPSHPADSCYITMLVFLEVRKVGIVLVTVLCNVQGHIVSVVRREAAENLTPLFQPVMNGTSTVIPRLTKIIRSGITFVSRNMMLSGVSLLFVSNVNNPVGLVGLPYVMWSAHFFVTHIQTEKISPWNGKTVHVCCFVLARASTKTFVSRVRKTAKKSCLAEKFVSRVTR